MLTRVQCRTPDADKPGVKPLSIDHLRALVLGAERRQQLRASQSLLALGVYAAFACVQHLEVVLGMIPAQASWPLTAWNLSGGVMFFLIIRSGLNLRLPRIRDVSLTVPQQLWAMTGIAWSYAITGPARGAVMLIMLLVVIYSAFRQDAGQARRLAGMAFVMLGGVMVWKAWTDPQAYDPRVEAMHLLFAGIVIATVSALAVRIGRLRQRLQEQRGELSEALERIRRLATHDELTGLKNRRAALERLAETLKERSVERPALSLALIDLDHFKRINDTQGHAAGDAVLRRFAQCGQEVLGEHQLLARWGGEEFLLMLPDMPATEALRVLARLRQAVQRCSFADVAPDMLISFSAGVSECRHRSDLEAAIDRADSAMYQAKQAGRDRSLLAADCAQPREAPVPA